MQVTQGNVDSRSLPESQHHPLTTPTYWGYRLYALPQTAWGALAVLIRAELTVVAALPALLGALLAWWQFSRLDPVALFFTVLGSLTVAWGFHALVEYFDYQHSLQTDTSGLAQPFVTGYTLLRRGVIRPVVVRNLGILLLAGATLCCLSLYLFVGWPILFFYSMVLLSLAIQLLLPMGSPLRAWGLGEVGLFLGMGLLPTVASYYIQSRALTWLPIWLSLPLGLLVVVIYLNYNFAHQRRDWLIRKRTLNVTLGLARALDLSALLSLLAYVAILLGVSLTELPLWALLGLAPLPVALRTFAFIRRERLAPEECFQLYGTAIHATVLTGFCLAVALGLDWLL
ncbi:prenyltransferase [Litorilinea aerophila]|uniref:prenyltransferase n=1 Tax=Litorilinea aerophila TaxID=1204385 RepID=UPI0014772809|nr:prenyltransferase [Litorilinea aerophila]MCC9075890.1 prenyltransferase [Litorilinea aerophila]GIV77179.1 MAG: hypothetical protein KatS3mg050_1573 [Litorilinea sp.]